MDYPKEVREDLEKSGLNTQTVLDNNLRMVPIAEFASIVGHNNANKINYLLEFPYHHLNGSSPFSRYRLYPPIVGPDGRARKYQQIAGTESRLYIPRSVTLEHLQDTTLPIMICEGEKKTLAACQSNLGPAVGVGGVWNWVREGGRPISDLDLLKLQGRDCLICFDSDIYQAEKATARQGAYALAKELEMRGARVEFVIFPDGPNGKKVGLDDYLVAHSIQAFHLLPKTNTSDSKKFRGMRTWWNSWKRDHASKKGPDFYELVARHILQTNAASPIIYVGGDGFYRYCDAGYYQVLSRELLSVEIRCGIRSYQKQYGPEEPIEATSQMRREIEEAMRDVLLKEQPGVDLNKAVGILNVQNGFLDLATLTLRPHNPNTHFTLQFNARFDAGAKCPLWLSTLKQIFANDDEKTREDKIETLRRFFGLCLIPDQTFQKILVMIGEGANGKSLILGVLMGILGRENYSSVAVDQLVNPFYLSELQNKLVNISSEINAKNAVSDALIKKLSGEDSITADRKFRDPVKFFSFARLLFSVNEVPLIEDRTHAFYRRLLVVEFTRTFTEDEQQRDLREQLLRESDGILLWMLSGLVDLRKDNRFPDFEAIKSAVMKFRRENNSVLAFAEQWLNFCGFGELTKGEVYAAYKEWCEKNGKRAFAANKFSQLLHKAVPGLEDRRSTGGTRVWTGITFTGEVDPGLARRFASNGGSV